MQVNADFSQRVLVRSSELQWADSPVQGVQRRMLDRVGGEVARATSIVRFAANSRFPSHLHGGGEEFIVLEGVFEDEFGEYPVGSYVRNPPQSQHTPGSKSGCTLLVKLWQFDLADRRSIFRRVGDDLEQHRAGYAQQLLHQDAREKVRYLELKPNIKFVLPARHGLELFVLEGEIEENEKILKSGDWLRLPCDSNLELVSGQSGGKLWLKQGHLQFIDKDLKMITDPL